MGAVHCPQFTHRPDEFGLEPRERQPYTLKRLILTLGRGTR